MNPKQFVAALSAQSFENAFNPYRDRCVIHDRAGAPSTRARTLARMLKAAERTELDSLWVGRDLGYRGGRRTGLALTDDVYLATHAARWGIAAVRPTKGPLVAERTAAVVWAALQKIDAAIFLWNVFPFHPHVPRDPFTNRTHNARERAGGEVILCELIALLRPGRCVAIGAEAALSVARVAPKCKMLKVRHPSYGGQKAFLSQINEYYGLCKGREASLTHQGRETAKMLLPFD
jgi:hypothetical protein